MHERKLTTLGFERLLSYPNLGQGIVTPNNLDSNGLVTRSMTVSLIPTTYIPFTDSD